MSFRSPITTPTQEQYALLGKLVADWAVIENLVGSILARMARCPDFTGLTLVEQMRGFGIDQAWENLVDIHQERYQHRFMSEERIAEAKAVWAEFKAVRKRRNLIAHAIWLRLGDGAMFAFKPKGRQYSPKHKESGGNFTNEELAALAAQLDPLREKLEQHLSSLAEVPEVP